EEGARIFHKAAHGAEWLAEHREGVTAVRPLAYVAEDGVVLYPRVLGAPLSDHLRRPSQAVAQCLERAGMALHTLHRLPQGVAGPLPPHDFAAEVSETARASRHIPVLLPSRGVLIDGLLHGSLDLRERRRQAP